MSRRSKTWVHGTRFILGAEGREQVVEVRELPPGWFARIMIDGPREMPTPIAKAVIIQTEYAAPTQEIAEIMLSQTLRDFFHPKEAKR